MSVETTPGSCPLCGPTAGRTAIARGRDFEYSTTGEQEFTVARCSCGIAFLDPRPVDERIGDLYPADYEPYRFDTLPRAVQLGRELVQRRKVSVLRRLAGDRAHIVDVGCGAGALLRLLRRYGPPGWQLSGWDFPGAHLDRVRADGFGVIEGPLWQDLAPRDAQLFILNQVIEHVPQPDRVLMLLARALRSGGHLFVETPDLDGLDARLFSRRYWGGYHFPRHLVLFNRRSLEALVERTGLDVVETRSLPSPAFWIQSLHHALSEQRGLGRLSRWFTLRNPLAVGAATTFDLLWSRFLPTSNLRLIARKR